MDTYFASPQRAGQESLIAEIDCVNTNQVMSGLLQSISGLLAILNEHRQIVALNDSFLKMLGIENPAKVLGLRPGEALECIHAHDEPTGCGTSKFCSTCGAAIAIVSSLGKDKPVERICALAVQRGSKEVDIVLLVRARPMKMDGKRFLLLFLQDITRQYQLSALERTFFHDVNNMLLMLMGASELLEENNPSELSRIIHQTSSHLIKEVAIQRSLSENESTKYQPLWHEFTSEQIIKELRSFFDNHPAAQDKNIEYPKNYPLVSIRTDISLLLRVLCNMVINALEATPDKGRIRIWLEEENGSLTFYVWNAQEISPEISRRIFQRNFSTKDESGRGVGTYSMKLFGEEILGGRVNFTTSPEGTIFKFDIPL